MRKSLIFGYCRASTDKQVDSCATQEAIIGRYAVQRGMVVNQYFADNAVSGRKNIFDRIAGRSMMAQLQKGDTVICAHLDRMTRSQLNFLQIVDYFQKRGVIVHFINLPIGAIDLENPWVMAMIQVMTVFSELDRKANSVRTREGLWARKNRGQKYTKNAPIGWKLVKTSAINPKTNRPIEKIVPDDNHRRILIRMLELQNVVGLTINQIAIRLNNEGVGKPKFSTKESGRWSRRNVEDWLRAARKLFGLNSDLSERIDVINRDWVIWINREEGNTPIEMEDESQYFDEGEDEENDAA